MSSVTSHTQHPSFKSTRGRSTAAPTLSPAAGLDVAQDESGICRFLLRGDKRLLAFRSGSSRSEEVGAGAAVGVVLPLKHGGQIHHGWRMMSLAPNTGKEGVRKGRSTADMESLTHSHTHKHSPVNHLTD